MMHMAVHCMVPRKYDVYSPTAYDTYGHTEEYSHKACDAYSHTLYDAFDQTPKLIHGDRKHVEHIKSHNIAFECTKLLYFIVIHVRLKQLYRQEW